MEVNDHREVIFLNVNNHLKYKWTKLFAHYDSKYVKSVHKKEINTEKHQSNGDDTVQFHIY